MYARSKNFTGRIEMSRYAMCPVCGRRLHRTLDSWGDWDGESYTCEYCARNDNQSDSESIEVFSADSVNRSISATMHGIGNSAFFIPFDRICSTITRRGGNLSIITIRYETDRTVYVAFGYCKLCFSY